MKELKEIPFHIRHYYCGCGVLTKMKTLDNEPSPPCSNCGSNMREITEKEFKKLRGWHTDEVELELVTFVHDSVVYKKPIKRGNND